ERDQEEQDDHPEADQRRFVLLEARPEELTRATSGDLLLGTGADRRYVGGGFWCDGRHRAETPPTLIGTPTLLQTIRRTPTKNSCNRKDVLLTGRRRRPCRPRRRPALDLAIPRSQASNSEAVRRSTTRGCERRVLPSSG